MIVVLLHVFPSYIYVLTLSFHSTVWSLNFKLIPTWLWQCLWGRVIPLPNCPDLSLLYVSLGGGWQGGVTGAWRGCSDLQGQGLRGILYCMMTERGIRWVRYHSVFWSRLSEVNSQWPWASNWQESRRRGRCGRGYGEGRGGLGDYWSDFW